MKVGVFIGVETAGWNVDNFVNAAKTIQNEGADTLLFKVSDGADGDASFVPINQAGLQICSALKQLGITPIPYLFAYGDDFGGMTGEVAIANKYLDAGYDFCYDMETSFDGHAPSWGQFYEANTHQPFYVSTWANVGDHNWHSTIQGLGTKVKLYMPQVYTGYDASVYLNQYALCGIPATRLSPTFTAATLGSVASFPAPGNGVSLWEIMGLSSSEVTAVVKQLTPAAAPDNPAFDAECLAVWNSFFETIKEPAPPTNTAVFAAWKLAWTKGHMFGPAESYEYTTTDNKKTPLKFQNFSGVHAEHNPATQVTKWFGPNGEITF